MDNQVLVLPTKRRSWAAWMAWCSWLFPVAVLVVASVLDQTKRFPKLTNENHMLVFAAPALVPPSLIAWAGVCVAAIGISRRNPRLGGTASMLFNLLPAFLATGTIVYLFETTLSEPDKFGNARVTRSSGDSQLVELAPMQRKRAWGDYIYDRKFAYVDRAGNVIISFQFDYAFPFREGLAVAEIAGKHGIIDGQGQWVVPPRFDQTGILYKDGYLAVKENGRWGYLDQEGILAIPLRFDEAQMFFEGLAAVMVDEKWGFIDMSGTFVIAPQFTYVRGFKEGMAPAYIGGSLRFVSTTETMGWRLQGGKWGAINSDGEVVIQPQYDEAFAFCDGIATVVKNGNKFSIDRSGAPIN